MFTFYGLDIIWCRFGETDGEIIKTTSINACSHCYFDYLRMATKTQLIKKSVLLVTRLHPPHTTVVRLHAH